MFAPNSDCVFDQAKLLNLTDDFALYIRNFFGKNPSKDLYLLFKAPMATGKTTFIAGLAKSLGIDEQISSPTFTGVHEHQLLIADMDLNFFHLDLYQNNLNSTEFIEFLDRGRSSLFAIEWSEKLDPKILNFLEKNHENNKVLDLQIEIINKSDRKISLRECFYDCKRVK